jgi:hypothetical protein
MLKTCLLLLSLYCLVIDCFSMAFTLTRDYPIDPWEAGATTEAARFAQGRPLFESFRTGGHSTQMYGWANPVLLGSFFRFIPPQNEMGRILTFFCALCVFLWMAWWVSKGTDSTFRLFSFASFFSIQHIALNYTAINRPDWLCIVFCMGFVFLYRKHLLLSLVSLLLAGSFKQTASMWSILPFVVAVWETKGRPQKSWLKGLIPIAVQGAYLAALKVFFPTVFFYSYEAFAQYPVPLKTWFLVGWRAWTPFCLFLALAWTSLIKPTPLKYGRELFAALIISFIACTAAMAKPGGTFNSLIPFYLVVTSLSLFWFWNWWPKKSHSGQNAIGWALLALWTLQNFPQGPVLNRYFLRPDARQVDHPRTVQAVAHLPGKVLCPEDPTIVLFAKNEFGRNAYLERDAQGTLDLVPELRADMENADYIVDAVDWWGDEYVSPAILENFGYAPDQDFRSYRIWKKVVRK